MLFGLFRDWQAFFLLLLVAATAGLVLYFRRSSALTFSSVRKFQRLRPSWTLRARSLLLPLRILVLIIIVFALARPQKGKTETRVSTEGIDIEIVVDCSLSMLSLDLDNRMSDQRRAAADIRSGHLKLTDFKNRLEVVKEVVKEFVKGRGGDRIGLTVFADTAQLQCPLTTNHGILLDIVDRLHLPTPMEMLEANRRREQIWGGRTAIGWGIASGTKRLADSKAKSKVMILLTDGSNNVWDLTPETATEMAKALKIKIYTIGAGTEDQSYRLGLDMDGSYTLEPMPRAEIDEGLLKRIAKATGGTYFRARDEKSLRKIYQEIDKMEKVKTEGTKYTEYDEWFPYFLWPALGLLLVEIGLGNTRLQKLP